MSEQQLAERKKRKPGPKPTGKRRVMVSVPGPLANVVKEMVRVYREQERQP